MLSDFSSVTCAITFDRISWDIGRFFVILPFSRGENGVPEKLDGW